MKNLNKHSSYVIIGLICISIVLGIYSVLGMPLFSDSAFHASIIRNIVQTEKFPVYSPVGWVAQDMHPLSLRPFLTHPPLFYTAGASLALLGLSIQDALSVLAIIPTALSILYLYKINRFFFKNSISLLSALFLTVMPMSIWLISHRLMEPLQYFLCLSGLYYLISYSKVKNNSYLVLSGMFLAAVLYIKITSLFFVVGGVITLFLLLHKFKEVFFLLIIILILYTPYTIFSLKTRGTISYAPPGFPVIDKYIFHPWWTWKIGDDEVKLNNISQNDNIILTLQDLDFYKRSYIQNDIKKLNLSGALQKFFIFPISASANTHWFSDEIIYSQIYLLLFVLGIIFYIFHYRKSKYHYLLLPTFFMVIYYLTKTAELRYFFVLNILVTTFLSISLIEFTKIMTSVSVRVIFLIIFAFSLSTILNTELQHSKLYKNSLVHNLLPEGQGIWELKKIEGSFPNDKNKTIFTPANSEISYYWGNLTAWDNRLLFIPKGEIDKYLDLYNVSLIVIPNYLRYKEVYDIKNRQFVLNTVSNWQGNTIPTDSGFISYLNDEGEVNKILESQSFKVYKRIIR